MRFLRVSATVCFVLSASSSALAETPEVPPPPVAAPPTAMSAGASSTPPAAPPSASAPAASAPAASTPAASAPAASAPSARAAAIDPRTPQRSRSDVPRTEVEPEIPEGSSYRPPVVVAYEGGRVPKDSKLEQRPRAGLIATGIALTGSAYAAALTYAISTCGAQMECRNGSAWLYAPVIGPFVAATRAPTSGGMALAAFDGAVQSIGVALFAAGFLAPKTMVVTYRDTAIRLAPVGVGSAMGVGVLVQSL